MSTAVVYSRASLGIDAPIVTVETHISNGLPGFSIVGMAEKAVKESRDRVRSALLNTHFEYPAKRITVNLAPADLPKYGSRFDLAIVLSILAASGQIPSTELGNYEFVGELALTGELRPVPGILPFAIQTSRSQRSIILPIENANEAKIIEDITAYPAKHFLEVCGHFTGGERLQPHPLKSIDPESQQTCLDLEDVYGQQQAKRALEVAAAGGHNILFFGPPGTGKSMLATRLPGILPKLNNAEALEVAAIASLSNNGFKTNSWRQRPFRSPHHTASSVALVGGGSPPRPGEISLAHHGVLFLDELPEFNRKVLEAMREPLEAGVITISRAAQQAEFPAQFQLVAAMNPCPCGYLGDPDGRCHCSQEQVSRYRSRLSGPLLDRLDMHVEVGRLCETVLTSTQSSDNETSASVRARVEQTRNLQLSRNRKINAELAGKELEKLCQLKENDRELLAKAIKQLRLSARAYHRILRVSRTIADLENSENIQRPHVLEALSYRSFERYK